MNITCFVSQSMTTKIAEKPSEGKLLNEVHQDGRPRLGGYWQLFQLPVGFVSWWLCMCTCGAGGHIVLHHSSEARPMEIVADEFRCPCFPLAGPLMNGEGLCG